MSVYSLRNELQELVLRNVEVPGEENILGTGSYGSVQEVRLVSSWTLSERVE